MVDERDIENRRRRSRSKLVLPPGFVTLRVLFRCNLLDVSSVFWLFFQDNLILIIILIDPV